MTSRRLRFADRRCSVALTVLVSLAAVSCTATGEPDLQLASAAATGEAGAQVADATGQAAATTSGAVNVANEKGGAPLPDQVGYVPIGKPGEATPAQAALVDAENSGQAASAAEQPKAAAETAQATAAQAEKPPVQQDTGFYLTAGTMPEKQEPAKKGFLASLFGASPAKPAAPKAEKPKPIIASAAAESQSAAAEPQEKAKPIVSLESTKAKSKQVAMASLSSGDSDWALPGVRTTDLFEIKRKSGINDDSDVDINEGDDGSYEIASAAGLARLAPNGLLKQNGNVDVSCLKPSLVRVLKAVEQRFGKKMIVTSGYRDPDRNRRVGGAKKSLHMACAAADIQVPGVGKWELATFLRSMPSRGGVGTYCSTNSVHVDVGPERDWNWRCGRRG